MWLVPTQVLCRKHLLGEHVELHMLVGTLKKQKSIKRFIEKEQLEIPSIESRHSELVSEMGQRGYNHKSPLLYDNSLITYLPTEHQTATINRYNALQDLVTRCPQCNTNYQQYIKTC